MKSIILKSFKWLLAVMGFTLASCGRTEYGCPYMNYKIDGTVTDTEENPIEGIKVSVRYFEEKSTATDAAGDFTISEEYAGTRDEIELIFTDVDGEENGGYFGTTTKIVPLTQVKAPGKKDSSWYTGDFAGTADIVLERTEMPEEDSDETHPAE